MTEEKLAKVGLIIILGSFITFALYIGIVHG